MFDINLGSHYIPSRVDLICGWTLDNALTRHTTFSEGTVMRKLSSFIVMLSLFFILPSIAQANVITATCDASAYVDCNMPLTTDAECKNFLYQWGVAKAVNAQFCCTGAPGDMTFNYWNVPDPCSTISISGGTASITFDSADKGTICSLNFCFTSCSNVCQATRFDSFLTSIGGNQSTN
jgi:hypothetical protein